MANLGQADQEQHLAKFDQGPELWNRWRVEDNGFTRPNLRGVDFSQRDLRGIDLRGVDLKGANLTKADLRHVDLRQSSLSRAVLSEANMCEANLRGALLAEADLRKANLRQADLSEANLRAANLHRASMEGAVLYEANLRGAVLDRAALNDANLRFANFENANLRGAHLTEAYVEFAHFGNADLSEAWLSTANFANAELIGANLSSANLDEVNFSWANLTGADLTKAKLYKTVFGSTNMSGVHGLDQCAHTGPSVLDYSTLDRSGMLPVPFLRGCGLPESFITYLPSLLNEVIQFHSCFISYSTSDQDFADRLYADLQNKGVRCWFAPHDIQGGKKIHEQIDQAIQVHDRLLLLISDASMNSAWVKTEIAKARKRETHESRRMLFPVRLVGFAALRSWECFDGDTGKDSAQEIREYYVPDFSNWKDHDCYQREFEKLLRDLKAEPQ